MKSNKKYLSIIVVMMISSLPAIAGLLESTDSSSPLYQGVKSYWSVISKKAEEKTTQIKNYLVNRWAEISQQKTSAKNEESQASIEQTTASTAVATSVTPEATGVTPLGAGGTTSESTATSTAATTTADATMVESATTTPGVTASTAATSPTANTVTTSIPVASQVTTTAAAPKVAPSTPTTAITEQQQFKNVIQQTRQAVQAKEVIQVSQPGRAGTSVLQKLKSGVPIFALKQKKIQKDKKGKKKAIEISVKEIPRLDIGSEPIISKNDLVSSSDIVGLKQVTKIKELQSPALHSAKAVAQLKKKPIAVVGKAISPKIKGVEVGQLVSMKKIEAVNLQMAETQPLAQLKPYQEFSNSDLDMLAAVILFEKGDNCHLTSGLLTDLANNKEHNEEANYYMGICAHQMGFHSEAVSRLLRVIQSENVDFTSEAVGNIVEDLPREYDAAVAKAIRNLKNKSLIPDKHSGAVNFILSRAAHADGEYKAAAQFAAKVNEKHKLYAKAQFLYAIAMYGQGQKKESEETLLKLRTWMQKSNINDKNLEGLVALNLARMRFTQNRYQAANDEYMKIPKDQPIWVQALIEQGWTQLNIDDPEGAIGNMYSLHSPYFKSVFMPESWVVRTIGYIDICQYGDAYRTLTRLEQSHKNWLAQVDAYIANKKAPKDYYNTVKTYIRGKSDQAVDGLPSQIIREIARQKEFLNTQGALNVLEDEIAQYQFIYGFVKRDQTGLQTKLKKTKARLAKIDSDIASVKTKPENARFVAEWKNQKKFEEQSIRSYQYHAQLLERARLGFLRMKNLALDRIDGQKSKLRTDAGRNLMAHLKDVHKRLTQIFEGNEFLRYEIFAGSGENIRYQVAGGETSDARRIPANIKPQKILNWEFDGEYWEDEIGSYRSTLKNNCPKHLHTKTKGAGIDRTAQNN